MPLNVYRMRNNDFKQMFADMRDDLLLSPSTDVGEWQSTAIDTPMRELTNVSFALRMPPSPQFAAELTGAHLPWAEDHFIERVSGQPMNPAPSEAWWPFAKRTSDGTNRDHKSEGEAFSHTYPERIWPKYANMDVPSAVVDGKTISVPGIQNMGIRFAYGDLNDVVKQLLRNPNTRQAYLPIWFPEDTGGAGGRRVPCTLGYHFQIRDRKLSISYFMRSTDLLRHFQDDVYLAIRLAQWVAIRFNNAKPLNDEIELGELIFHTANLHIFEPDVDMLTWMKSQNRVW